MKNTFIRRLCALVGFVKKTDIMLQTATLPSSSRPALFSPPTFPDPPRRLEPVSVEYDSDEVDLIREAAAEDGQSLQEFLSSATKDFLKKPARLAGFIAVIGIIGAVAIMLSFPSQQKTEVAILHPVLPPDTIESVTLQPTERYITVQVYERPRARRHHTPRTRHEKNFLKEALMAFVDAGYQNAGVPNPRFDRNNRSRE